MNKYSVRIASVLIASTFVLNAQAVHPQGGSPEHYSDVQVTGHIYKPNELPPPAVAELHVPAGFRVEKFAENLGNVRILAIGPDGSVYVTRREEGDVLMFKVGADGLPAGAPVRVASRSGLHGIAISKGKVYLATVHEVFKADLLPDGRFGPLAMIIHDLPDAGQHNTRTIQIGPDDMMYISVGSTCNECIEPNPENATLLRCSLDGKTRSVFASGLRDTIGWGWQPETGELWGMDHGMDWLGDETPPEEINHIEKGKRYGWPFVYADSKLNPHVDPPGGVKKADWAKDSTPMFLGYVPHSAPMQLSFYNGLQFPQEYQGDAFVSMRGSWNRKPPSGYEVVRIHFSHGVPEKVEPFVTGFVTQDGEHGRLVGNAVAHDGSLLFTDDRNGLIYRVSYFGDARKPQGSLVVPAGPMLQQSGSTGSSALAISIFPANTNARLTVTSTAFENEKPLPPDYSSYGQNASPPVLWSNGPSGTKSYALLLEDPDAKSKVLPVIHWAAWNIPASVTNLREGLESLDRLQEPEGLRQGVNSSGTVGYKGPRPPAGDAAHHYHLQIFALDKMLDLPLGAGRNKLVTAMQGHVLSSGEIVALFARPDHPAKP